MEPSTFVMPLWAFDQFAVSEAQGGKVEGWRVLALSFQVQGLRSKVFGARGAGGGGGGGGWGRVGL